VSGESSLGISLEYEARDIESKRERSVSLDRDGEGTHGATDHPRVSFIGAGNYAGRILIPAFKTAGAQFGTVITESGIRGVHYGVKNQFGRAGTDAEEALTGPDEIVAIATRHDSHAELVARGLRHGKHVFVEKPLALTADELSDVEVALREAPGCLLMVGFNRRFAPLVRRMKSLLTGIAEPVSLVMTVNAGRIPSDHWTQDPGIGGGRIVGEACHFIDLLRFLAGAPITRWEVTSMAVGDGTPGGDDCSTLTLRFADGSFGTVHYLANGHKSFPKERLEVFGGGRVLQLDNFRRLRGFGWKGFRRMSRWRQDKGQRAAPGAFLRAVKAGGPAPIPAKELLEVSRVSIEAANAARAGGGAGELT
jgi:predicted dehydrogenase